MRTIEEILADMQAIVDKPSPTAEDIVAYAELEAELAAAQAAGNAEPAEPGEGATDDNVAGEGAPTASAATRRAAASMRQRHARYTTVVVPPGRPSNGPRRTDTIDRAFDSFLRTGRPNADLTRVDALGTDNGPDGGYLVPEGFRDRMIERMKAFGGLAKVVFDFPTAGGENVPWPTLDDTSSEGEIVEEGGTFSGGTSLEFGEATLGAYQYQSGGPNSTPIRLSLRLLRDSKFPVEAIVSGALSKRIARVQARHWVKGTGVKQPQGIVTGKTGIQLAAQTGVTNKDLLKFIHSVDPEYRESAGWSFNDNTLETLRGIEDDNGRPILKSSTDGIAGAPGGETLLGYPVTIDQAFDDISLSSATQKWGVFGDLEAAYVLRRVEEVAILINPYSRMQYGQLEYSAIAWADGLVQDANAFVALTGKA